MMNENHKTTESKRRPLMQTHPIAHPVALSLKGSEHRSQAE